MLAFVLCDIWFPSKLLFKHFTYIMTKNEVFKPTNTELFINYSKATQYLGIVDSNFTIKINLASL